jgi:hypothetical protein
MHSQCNCRAAPGWATANDGSIVHCVHKSFIGQ